MVKHVIDSHYAKNGEYAAVLGLIEKRGRCPFCPKHFRYHKHPVLARTPGWFLTRSSWPYKNSRQHFLFIGNKHRERIAQLTVNDLGEILRLLRWCIRKFRIRGGALALRFGSTRYTGATVCHLHFHLIVPKLDRKTKRALVIQFPIG